MEEKGCSKYTGCNSRDILISNESNLLWFFVKWLFEQIKHNCFNSGTSDQFTHSASLRWNPPWRGEGAYPVDAVNLLLWKKILTDSFQNHYSKQTRHHPQQFLYNEIRISHYGRGSPCKPKSLNFPLYLIAFRQILPKFLPPVTCIFSYTIITYFKSSKTKSLSTKQCSAVLSPRIIPLYPPFDQNCPLHWCCFVAPTRFGLFPFSHDSFWKTLRMEGEPHSTAKYLLIFPTRKIPLNTFTFSPIKTVIPSTIK